MLSSSIKQFKYYKQLADKAMAQIQSEQVTHRFHENDNSIAIIISHMSGNMKSRWTNIFTEDGEKSWRNRDQEFEPKLSQISDILSQWEEGWKVLFDTLGSITENDLNRTIYIRNEGMSVSDAILRQLCHYSYHCGQIVYKCKQLAGDHWDTLSIAKNQSEAYNFKKFEQIAEQKHFLDSLLDQGS
jgi:uncharacterized damage-inducible protein DinB